MYNEFYGFTKKPFEVTPDTGFLYLTPVYQEILATLVYAVNMRKGIVALVGEAGTGKTLMLNAMVERLEPSNRVAFLFHTGLTFKQMLLMVLHEFGLVGSSERVSLDTGIRRLAEFARITMRDGGNVVVVADEAQLLSHQTMVDLRMLTSLETPHGNLIQIVLSGQPELDEKLQQNVCRQLAQRVCMKRHTYVLSRDESVRYVEHRLRTAGYAGPPLFTARAVELIWQYSEGIARKINLLCDNALLIGYGIGRKTIDETVLQEALADMDPRAGECSGCAAMPPTFPMPRSSQRPTDGGAPAAGRSEFYPEALLARIILRVFHRQVSGQKLRRALVAMALLASGAMLFVMPL